MASTPSNPIDMRFRFEGFNRLSGVFQGLPKRVQSKVLRKGVQAGATPILKATRAYARQIKDTGLLAKSQGRRSRQYSRKGGARDGKTHVQIIGARTKVVQWVPRSKLKKKPIKTGSGGKHARRRKKRVMNVMVMGKRTGRYVKKKPSKYAHLAEGGTKFARPTKYASAAFGMSVVAGQTAMNKAIIDGIHLEANTLAFNDSVGV